MPSGDCVDLTSDAEGSAGGGTPVPAPAAAPPADDCICLLSSDADSPPPTARRDSSSKAAPATAGVADVGVDPAPPAAASPEQAGGRRARRARTLRSAYGDEVECDVAALASPPGLQSPSPKRRRRTGPGAAALATPESVGPPIAEAEADADYRQSQEPSPLSQPLPRGRRGRLTAEERAEREAAKAAERERRQRERAEARELRKQEQAAAKAARQAEAAQRRLDRRRETGKTAFADMTVHLDPELAKHRTGREAMRALEEGFGAAGGGGPSIELGARLPLWPLRSLTWSRVVHAGGGAAGQTASQQSGEAAAAGAAAQQAVPYAAVCFTAEEFVAAVEADGLRSLVERAARECGGCTLLLLVEGLEHHLAQRQRRDFQAHGPGGGGFSRAPIDDFLAGMACRWPGVRHAVVADAAAAAEHLAGLTRALAEQPFRAEAAYVSSFGAGKPDSQAMGELLRKAPLPDAGRQAWFRALACIPSLGPQIAHVVCATHASMGALIAAYQCHPGGEQQRRGMLADLVRFGGQRVGPANSRKVCDVLTGEDAALCIQDAR